MRTHTTVGAEDSDAGGLMAFETADRRGIAELVGHCLRAGKPNLAKPGPQPPLPIILLWGPRSSGKSEVLNHLQERFSSGRPNVRRDGSELRALRPHVVALKLASHLSCRVMGLGRLRFPRLSLGTAAIRGPLDVDDSVVARSEMIRRTVPSLRRLRGWVGDASTILLSPAVLGVGLPPETGRFLGLALGNGVGALIERGLVRRARSWYQDGLGLHFPAPVDALVRLAEWEAVPHQQAMVDETLCRAFLADLRDEYLPHRFQPLERRENCLALLDDADSEGAQRFLNILAAQRTDWDPLLIVAATSTRAPSPANQQPPERWVVRDAANATYRDWSENRHKSGWTALYPVALSGLTLHEARMHGGGRSGLPHTADVELAAVLGDTDKALRFAHRLTGGHVGGMRLVLRTMSLQCQLAGTKNVDVRGVFGWPVTEGGFSLAEEVWQLLVDGRPEEMRKALVRATAAPDLADHSFAKEHELVRSMMRRFRSRDLWVHHPQDHEGKGPPTFHPFPRRAALHLLAQPSGQEGLTWDDVHTQLRYNAGQQGDVASEMYHHLALDHLALVEVREVTKYLNVLFEEVQEPKDAQKWYDTLTAITQAPLAHPTQGPNAEEHLRLLLKNVGEESAVPAKLVAALQIHADPLGDPSHHLCLTIAQELEEIKTSDAFFFMPEKIEKFRDCWRQWHDDSAVH
jgi:hypothetical protein